MRATRCAATPAVAGVIVGGGNDGIVGVGSGMGEMIAVYSMFRF